MRFSAILSILCKTESDYRTQNYELGETLVSTISTIQLHKIERNISVVSEAPVSSTLKPQSFQRGLGPSLLKRNF